MTIIVGVNGAGKTSILEAAAIAVGTLFQPIDNISAPSIKRTDARLQTFEMGKSVDVQAQYPVEIEANGNIDGHDIKWKRCLNGPNGSTTVKEANDLIAIAKGYQERMRRGDTSLILPIIAYYGTGRLWDYHRAKQSDIFRTSTRSNGYIDILDGTANLKLMMSWFRKMTVEKYQRQELGEEQAPELNAVYSAMEACFSRFTEVDDVKIRYNLNTNELDVDYTEKSGVKVKIPLSRFSDGYKSTISLIADIAYRMAVLNPQLLDNVCSETDGIILIDEIDLHLHPLWQQRVLSDLAAIFPKVQFIVSTHAPSVISSVKSENTVLLDDNEVFQPSGEIHGRDANTIVSSVMGSTERPIEIKRLFTSFYNEIDQGNEVQAQELLEKIEDSIGDDDSELAGCRVKLKLLKLRRGK